MEYKIGMILDGTITGLQPYGAFVSLNDTVQGLIHVSEVQAGFTKNIHSLLTVGQKVKVQVIDIDEYSKKISLSLRTLETQIQQLNHRRKKYFTNKNKKIGFETLEHELPIWRNEAMNALLEK
ncbi:S1 RNA-binding domain-containing protein [Enterococcus plantarum]|uniref:CvfD/Ygs/GSP13 family RNA-binding post-transcriptional regulator n=1 Tax=Enterococcus plantarum TaxID=1077675 RepID=UPI001A8FFB72|nr:CvfD/Ygs/GSP13 family RNA-binding post-transcriptional regulator [Enterococcus plantarum]MBO0468861.1 S1 RNA-binding domain-containing protein [Enterococcus plantarum]